MDSSDFVTDENSVVIVSLNISETNETINGTKGKAFMKRPSDDSSINNIIFGIGVVVVVLIFILIIIKLIYKCYKMYHADDEDKKDAANNSPLLPSPSTSAVRRNSSVRNPAASTHRSSLPVSTLMDIQQKRLSKTPIDTPPIIRKT